MSIGLVLFLVFLCYRLDSIRFVGICGRLDDNTSFLFLHLDHLSLAVITVRVFILGLCLLDRLLLFVVVVLGEL